MQNVIEFIRAIYKTNAFIPLHVPKFIGNEKKYVDDAIASTIVSSVGEYVNRFEEMICQITGSHYTVATVNGTSALHIALKMAGVEHDDEVITQPVTFVATANAIAYCGAKPVFLDVERSTMGLSPDALQRFLKLNATTRDDRCYNMITGNRLSACVPMHTFGHPCRIDAIVDICNQYHIPVIEDSAESLGSTYKGQHTGTFGLLGIYSFNGNKTVTCGGGGAIVTNEESLAKHAKHVTTTAKLPHPFEYVHDEVGYNYRMPNLNAALACAQLEQLDRFIENKRELANKYAQYFDQNDIFFFKEPEQSRSNYWLNTIILPDLEKRNEFLEITNKAGIMTRPIWKLTNKLPMFLSCQTDELMNSRWLEERAVNIPSSVTL